MDRSTLPLCVDVLGPLALRLHGSTVEIPGLRRRSLLALLAIEGDRGVSTDRIVDALWPDDPPGDPAQALYNHVSRLRRHLGDQAERLERLPWGYRLRLLPFELDADAARRLAATDPGAALALWRGPALTEFRAVPELEIASVPLDELRRQLTDDVLEARLDAGDPGIVVDAVEAAAHAPLRERTTLLLVRALAASGRAVEAMEAAQAFRRRFVDETGLDPTPALAELEEQVAAGGLGRPSASRVVRPDGPMVGRQHDREEVLRLLGDHAVVTLTGPGGVGKTRLALDIAADWESSEANVVWLAAVERADRVEQAVASHLGLRLVGEADPRRVAQALADRRLLLVLDNCEHVAEACRQLVAALRRVAPGVKVLATSRTLLHAPEEYVVRLHPLPVPRDAADLDALRRQPGVRAFVEHARRRAPGFALEPGEVGDLIEVLRHLDGLPLGIELAARQLAVMPLRAVRERLDRALDLTAGRSGPEAARQRTLRASIASSYELLGEQEQRLLRALASFPGGADLATVETLARALGHADPLDLLHVLVESSLLVADAATGRYRMLFTVRSFLAETIASAGEEVEARARFVARCVVVAEEIRDGVRTSDEPAADRRLRAELDNLREARDLARDHADIDALVRITLAAMEAGTWRDLREIWTWTLELADDPVMEGRADRVTVVSFAAEAARLAGDFAAVARLADQAFALAGATSGPISPGHLARAWSARATVAHYRGEFDRAVEQWLAAADAALPSESAAFVCSAALAATYAGRSDEAGLLLERARAGMAEVGSPSQQAYLAYVEGEWRSPRGEHDPTPSYRRAIELAGRAGAVFVEGVARVSLAATQRRTGDLTGAAAGYAELLGAWRRTGHNPQLWTTARNAAELLVEAGRREVAALLLVCAEDAPGAAAVGSRIARYSARTFVRLSDVGNAEELARWREEARLLGTAAVLDRAEGELVELAR